MSDLELTTKLRKKLNVKVSKSVRICGCHRGKYYALFFFYPLCEELKLTENSVEESAIQSFEEIQNAVKVVGYDEVFLLDNEGKLFEYVEQSDWTYRFRLYSKLKFTKILAITVDLQKYMVSIIILMGLIIL